MYRRLLALVIVSAALLTACGSGSSDLQALTSDCMATAKIAGTVTGGTALQNDRTKQHGRVVPAGLVRSLPLAPGSTEGSVLQGAMATATSCGWTFDANGAATHPEGSKLVQQDALKLSLSFQGDVGGRFLVVDLSNQGH